MQNAFEGTFHDGEITSEKDVVSKGTHILETSRCIHFLCS